MTISTPLAYKLPDQDETYDVLKEAASSLAPGSESMVKNSLEQGRYIRARKAMLAGIEKEEVQDRKPIMKYKGAV